jgi:hypothetical protein
MLRTEQIGKIKSLLQKTIARPFFFGAEVFLIGKLLSRWDISRMYLPEPHMAFIYEVAPFFAFSLTSS